jgi:hypothetical protein
MKGTDIQMSKQEALYQSLAASGAVLLTFNGIYHLCAAEALFPWGPAFFGSATIFNGIGVVAIVAGILLLGAILRFYVFPVIAVSLVTSIIGLAIVILCETLHGQFNVFALSVAFAGILMAYSYRKAAQQSAS